MPNLAKIGQHLNGHERTLFLIIWLHVSLRHLNRPPRSKGQVVTRPLRGTLPNSLICAISTLLQKSLELDPEKRIFFYFRKWIFGKFWISELSYKIFTNKVEFAKVAKNAKFGQNWPTSERDWSHVILDILTPWIASASPQTPTVKRTGGSEASKGYFA